MDRRSFLKVVLGSGVTVALAPDLLANPLVASWGPVPTGAPAAPYLDLLSRGLHWQCAVETIGDLPTPETERWDEYVTSGPNGRLVRERYRLTCGDAVMVKDIESAFVWCEDAWVQLTSA